MKSDSLAAARKKKMQKSSQARPLMKDGLPYT
jgi:hypothetical protein